MRTRLRPAGRDYGAASEDEKEDEEEDERWARGLIEWLMEL
jgi:hypothetical protein